MCVCVCVCVCVFACTLIPDICIGVNSLSYMQFGSARSVRDCVLFFKPTYVPLKVTNVVSRRLLAAALPLE